jgi:phosphoenolpyruvate synthase/pyruvate phosphate dikinase
MSPTLKYVRDLFRDKENVGNKASNLHFLHKQGFKVPPAYVVGSEAYEDYKLGVEDTLARIEKELDLLLSKNKSYAVRSSTSIEDSSQQSYAGQFKTVLNTKGAVDIINAMMKIWDSAENSSVIDYGGNVSRKDDPIKISVIIQEMVEAEYSGVVFTKNPITGFDDVVVEVVKGLGTSLVQDGVTPDRWVSKWGAWREKPENPSIDERIIKQLVYEANRIQKKYGKPVDLEFAYDGKDVYWIQLREITTITGLKLYSNKISREMMPGVILPLVWSINIPINEQSWKMILRDLFGSSVDILNAKLAKQFYYRAYFNMGLFGDLFSILGMPRESIELMIGVEVPGEEKPSFKPGLRTLRYARRISAFSLGITTLPRRINRYIIEQKIFLRSLSKFNPDQLKNEEKVDLIDRLIENGVKSAYIVILTQLIYAMFSMMSKNKDITVDTNYDSNKRLGKLHTLYEKLSDEEKTSVEGEVNGDPIEISDPYREFSEEFNVFLDDFGHYSEHSNDLSYITWREKPSQVMQLIKNFQTTNEKLGQPKITFDKNNITFKYKLFRETVTYLYTKNYSYFRPLFLSIAKKLVTDGVIKKDDDIFYLSYDEIKAVIKGSQLEYDSRIAKRRWEVENVRDIVPPELIFTDDEPQITKRLVDPRVLRGISASGGRVSGTVKIVRNFGDAHKVSEGDIIVIPYSDVSWTTLFHKVKGIISESGGMLSHCAIIARECKIPAVVSVKGALNLKDGSHVLIDGDSGEIRVE